MPDESEKAPESGLRAPALEQSGAGSSQEPLPPALPIGDTTCAADGSADASPTSTLADCVELMFLSAADDVVASGIPPTHSVCTNKLMEDVGVAVDHLFDGPRRPKIPRGSGFLDKMEARAYVLADRIGHGLLPPIRLVLGCAPSASARPQQLAELRCARRMCVSCVQLRVGQSKKNGDFSRS